MKNYRILTFDWEVAGTKINILILTILIDTPGVLLLFNAEERNIILYEAITIASCGTVNGWCCIEVITYIPEEKL